MEDFDEIKTHVRNSIAYKMFPIENPTENNDNIAFKEDVENIAESEP